MFGPFDWTDVYKLDYTNKGTREAMIDAMSFWLTDVGVDGFRCDVAMQVPTDFWNEARPRLQALKPDLFMLAEASVPELEEHAFDMAYNWPMKDLFNAIAYTSGQYQYTPKEGEPHTFPVTKAADIVTLVEQQQADYPYGSYMMNMTSNHDLNSWEGTEFERLGIYAPAFAAITYVLPGMPLIYTGQEVGMNRAFEFFVKDKAPDWTPNQWTDLYNKLNALKHSRPELSADGSVSSLINYRTTSPDIVIMERRSGDSRTIMGANLGKIQAPVTFTGLRPDTEGAKWAVVEMEYNDIPSQLLPGEFFFLTVDPKTK